MKKFIYLAAYKAYHPNHNCIYQDINGQRDIDGDMMDVDISKYDAIIATPPCNYYSRANYRRETSSYAQQTKHLLPEIIEKLLKQNKPFIVENVRNDKIFEKLGLLNKWCFIYKIGRHTYWTNIILTSDIEQKAKIEWVDGKKKYRSSQDLPRSKRQGTEEVHEVIEQFMEICETL